MGLLGSLTGSSGAKAAKKAAAIQTQARNEASAMLGQIIPQFQPVANMFSQFAPAVQQGATMQGFGQNLSGSISMLEDAYAPVWGDIMRERTEAGATQLANTGLSRSGAALRELAAIPTEMRAGLIDQAFNVENMLNQRQTGLMGIGMEGMGTIADIIGQQANIRAGIGDVQAQGKLGAEAARAQGAQNIMNLAAMGAGAYNGYQSNQLAAKNASDRRLKSDITHRGYMSSGLPFYDYTIFGKRETGVMAQDVLNVFPDAVSLREDGYYQVDYAGIY